MVADRVFAERFGDPAARGTRICHRLDGGERLGGDEKKRTSGIETQQHVRKVGAIDIRHVMSLRSVSIRRQCPRCHGRTEIGSADAYIDDVADALAGRAAQRSGPNPFCKSGTRANSAWTSGTTLRPLTRISAIGRRTQSRVQSRAPLGDIDRIAAQYLLTSRLEIRGAGECHQQINRLRRDPVLGEVDEHIAEAKRKTPEPFDILFEEGAHRNAAESIPVSR